MSRVSDFGKNLENYYREIRLGAEGDQSSDRMVEREEDWSRPWQVITASKSVSIDGASKHDGVDTNDMVTEGTIEVEFRNADLRDVLSALAAKMGANILLVESPGEVNFSIRDVSPRRAFELLLQKEGLSYIEEDGLYIVGGVDKLESEFFNRILLTWFELSYISAQLLQEILDDMDIPAQSVILEENPQSIWIQGTPFALAKVRQVIEQLDKPENAVFGEASVFADPGSSRVRIPVASVSGENAYERLDAQKEILSELTGVRKSRMYSININPGGEPHLILWVEESPQKVQRVVDMVEMIGEISGP